MHADIAVRAEVSEVLNIYGCIYLDINYKVTLLPTTRFTSK